MPAGGREGLVTLSFDHERQNSGTDSRRTSAYLESFVAIKSSFVSISDLMEENKNASLSGIVDGRMTIKEGSAANPMSASLSLVSLQSGDNNVFIVLDVDALEGALSIYSGDNALCCTIDAIGSHAIEVQPGDYIHFAAESTAKNQTPEATLSGVRAFYW